MSKHRLDTAIGGRSWGETTYREAARDRPEDLERWLRSGRVQLDRRQRAYDALVEVGVTPKYLPGRKTGKAKKAKASKRKPAKKRPAKKKARAKKKVSQSKGSGPEPEPPESPPAPDPVGIGAQVLVLLGQLQAQVAIECCELVCPLCAEGRTVERAPSEHREVWLHTGDTLAICPASGIWGRFISGRDAAVPSAVPLAGQSGNCAGGPIDPRQYGRVDVLARTPEDRFDG